MPHAVPILAVIRDPALLRALAFALEAHGYAVAAHATVDAAHGQLGAARCVILDGCLPPADRTACLTDLPDDMPVLLLAEDDTVYDMRLGQQVIQKPLTGADVVASLSSLIRRTT